MAVQFIPGYREANSPNRNQPELAIPGLQEEVKKKVNRPVPELALAEDTDIVGLKSEQRRQRQRPCPGHPGPAAAAGEDAQRVRGPFPAGRPHLPQLRQRHRPQRRLLQVPELRREPGVLVGIGLRALIA